MISEELFKLGFDSWFEEKTVPALNIYQYARVSAVNKNNFLVIDGHQEMTAELSGKFMFDVESGSDYPAAGDWVYIQAIPEEKFSIIHKVFPRKTILKRKTPGKNIGSQVIATNINTAIIMQGLDNDFNPRRLERYLVMINESSIEPVVFLSKRDLLTPSEIEEKKEKILRQNPGIKIITFSNNIEEDILEITNFLEPARTYCLLGSSGVGKSTLLNNLLHKNVLKTQEVREKSGKGKHTTTRRELLLLENGAIIIDTPGMRELGLMGIESGLEETFSEIAELTENCRFRDCTHTIEEGCAVIKALEDGVITMERYNNYKKMYKESLYYEMSYVEKRQKDKKFGKFLHSYMKHKKDKK
jgi:ribosome biogenesis GTPase / thiamine phosphate phosphatase